MIYKAIDGDMSPVRLMRRYREEPHWETTSKYSGWVDTTALSSHGNGRPLTRGSYTSG